MTMQIDNKKRHSERQLVGGNELDDGCGSDPTDHTVAIPLITGTCHLPVASDCPSKPCPRISTITSSLADQQDKRSGSYQHRNQNTDDERNNPMPTGLDLFRSSPFLRRSDSQPEEKFVHSSDRHHRRCFVAALLCLRLR